MKNKVTKRYDPEQVNEVRRLLGFKEISTKQRACLRCETTFISEGIHNRLCDPCRKKNAY